MQIYRQSISIFHQKSIDFFTHNVLIDINIDIDIFENVLIDIDIFKIVLIDIDINIDIFKIVLVDISDFKKIQKCWYINNEYFILIYRTGLGPPE